MKKQYYLYLILLINCLLLISQHLQASHYYFKQISLQDGLPSTVRCVFTEEKGFVWIGTWSGLGRFDGYKLKKYTHQPNHPNSLPSNHITQITEDKQHNIWILTEDGLARYDKKNDDFYIPKDTNEKNIIAYSSCLTEGGILFGARNSIYRYNYEDESLTLLQDFNNKSHFAITAIYFWDSERLLCCSRWEGIKLINIHTGEITPPPFDCGKEIRGIIIDSQKRIWIAPYNDGIKCFAQDGKLLATYNTRNSLLSNDVVLSLVERDGHIWIATDGGGINILNPETGQFTLLEHKPGDNYSLPVNSILCLHNDCNNNMWAGSIRSGLINIREVSMKTYTDVIPGYDNGLSDNTVLSLYQEKDEEEIWIGTDGGGINRFDPSTGKFKHYTTTWGDKVASITGYSKNELALSLFSKGIFIFNKSTGSYRQLDIPNKEINQRLLYSGKSINITQYDPDHILLLGDHIYVYTISTGTFDLVTEEEGMEISGTVVPIFQKKGYTQLNDIHCIYELDHSKKKIHTLFSYPQDTIINSVSKDGHGIFWIASNFGLGYYDPQNKKYEHISTSLFNEINSVICDQHGKLWIGADRTLFACLTDEKKFIIFGESDGVILNEYLYKPRLVSNQGDVYMGGVKGLLCIEKELPIETSEYPQVQLADISINGEPANSVLTDNPVGISVPWDTRSISIRVMSCERDIFRKKIFRYQIAGLNDQYIDSYNPELVIRSLPPGKYRIMASCSTKNGDWTEMEQIMTLTVLPPWYKTWWFILLCILFVSGIVIETFLITLRRKERKLKWAMKEHEQQVYEEKVRFLINISHELRTPLTLIHAPLDRMLKRLSVTDSNYLPIKSIFKQSQRMKNLLNMVLDLRKMEVGQSKLQIHPHQLNEWLSSVADDFNLEGDAKNIHIRFCPDKRIDQVSFDKEKCEIILTNLLINALKHSPENTEITLTSELLPEANRVRISISDQGCGLGQVDIQKLFTRFYQGNGEQSGTGIGLSYSKILAELHGGSIGARDNEGAGATFFFELPFSDVSADIACQPKAYLNELITDEPIAIPETETTIPTHNYSVLVVDDNPELVEFLQTTLTEHFKHVYTATDGAEALEVIGKELPDVVVSDVMMPRMNGYELCKQIKENIEISHIPVILLTARDDEQSKLQGYKTGADGYLTKPFEIDVLLELIRNRIQYREKTKTRYQHTGEIPHPEECTFSQADETFLNKMNKVITSNLDNPQLDIPFICKEIGVSRASLYNKLKALTDMGANDYINKFRMEKAIELVSNSELTFTEIAERVGFTTSRYFSTAFKQYTGETPSGYRANKK